MATFAAALLVRIGLFVAFLAMGAAESKDAGCGCLLATLAIAAILVAGGILGATYFGGQ